MVIILATAGDAAIFGTFAVVMAGAAPGVPPGTLIFPDLAAAADHLAS